MLVGVDTDNWPLSVSYECYLQQMAATLF